MSEKNSRSGDKPRRPWTWRQPIQLAASLVLLCLSVAMVAELIGLGTDPHDTIRRARAAMAESLAVQLSILASEEHAEALSRVTSSFVIRHPDVIAASLRLENGLALTRYGDPAALDTVESASTITHMNVPILADDLPWGEALVVFAPVDHARRELWWFAFVALGSFVSFVAFLMRVLVQMDPSRTVPKRVESAFDLFSAGVVILDEELRVVMANRAARGIADRSGKSLIGSSLDEWPWQREKHRQMPWATALQSGTAVPDQSLSLQCEGDGSRTFSVNCTSIGGDAREPRGVLVTLEDLTQVEEHNRELARALTGLQRSQEAIENQNRELERLASTDALTQLFNRRVLIERLDAEFERARREKLPLACIMLDIDHFKSVNDTYGHGVGDEVIRAVGGVLKTTSRRHDTAGRYGGEEFALVLPGLDARGAAELAERARVAVFALGASGRLGVPGLSASFGVTELDDALEDGSAMLSAADQALYVAKEGGRNRVVIHDPNARAVAEVTTAPPTERSAAVSSDVSSSEVDLLRARILELEEELGRSRRGLATLREFDTLTGVPMRALFLQRVEIELVRATRSGALVGVMSVELRGLERIVATLGHGSGDALVVAFVERLQEGLRSSDLVTEIADEHSLSRITSNEYGVLLCDMLDSAGAMIVVARLKRLLSQPFLIGKERVYVGANIGIALSDPASGDSGAAVPDAPGLIAQASEGRVEAASKPDKVSHGFASATLDDESRDYIRLEADLRDALAANALEVWFQPKFDLRERRVAGMEALLRWRHDTRGFVSPAVFVAVAEANGLMEQLSTLVLERTLAQIRIWNAMGFDHLRVSVNVSPVQLRAESLVAETLDALSRAQVPARQLEIELTETSVLDRPEQGRAALEAIREAGVGISMDDFGTGYTSLALLAELPFDTVKIDRSFVSAMMANERSLAVVESIISMGHALNLRVVSEGVETEEELETLARLGCDEVQGYLISRPLPAEEISEFLVRERTSSRRAPERPRFGGRWLRAG